MLFPKVTFNTFQTNPPPKKSSFKVQYSECRQIQNAHIIQNARNFCHLIIWILKIQLTELKLLSKDKISA